MEVSASSSSGLSFLLHPLILLNVSDHHTRTVAMTGSRDQRVRGILLGSQSGRTIEIVNSFEMKVDAQGQGGVFVDHAFLQLKLQQYKQVFPRLDLVGFYSTGASMDAIDLSINQEIMALNESPCILLLDTNIDPLRKNLPVTLYETEVHVLEGAPVSTLVSASYSIETSDAERIGVDQVAKISVYGDSGCDQLTSHLSGIHSAIKMLHERVAAIQRFVQAMDGGQQPFDHALVRKILSLVHSLPAMDSPEFKEEYAREVNDALMATQLALVTKGINQANDIVDSYTACYASSKWGGGGGGSGGRRGAGHGMKGVF